MDIYIGEGVVHRYAAPLLQSVQHSLTHPSAVRSSLGLESAATRSHLGIHPVCPVNTKGRQSPWHRNRQLLLEVVAAESCLLFVGKLHQEAHQPQVLSAGAAR